MLDRIDLVVSVVVAETLAAAEGVALKLSSVSASCKHNLPGGA